MLRKVFRIYPYLLKLYFINLNRILFKILGVNFGSNLRVFNKIYLSLGKDAKLKIGNNFTFTSGADINPLCRNVRGHIYITKNGEISIGNNTGISSSCLWAKEKITIGNYVNIGGDCIIMDTDAHNLDWKIRAGLGRDKNNLKIVDGASAIATPVNIEDHAFIGTRSIILKGVTIGARSIIGAGSVVNRSIPPDCIAAGNPCKVIKQINQS